MSSYKRNWLTKRDIFRRKDELYLSRYVVFQCRFFGIYIHKFWVSDYPVPHDHPWNFFSFIFTRGYREHLPDGTYIQRGLFSGKFRTANEFHWVELDKGPCWTLFIRFRAIRRWGFLTENGWVDHDKYNESLGIIDG